LLNLLNWRRSKIEQINFSKWFQIHQVSII